MVSRDFLTDEWNDTKCSKSDEQGWVAGLLLLLEKALVSLAFFQ